MFANGSLLSLAHQPMAFSHLAFSPAMPTGYSAIVAEQNTVQLAAKKASQHPSWHELTQLQHMFEVLPNGIVVLDSNGVVVKANPVAIALLGEPLCGQRWLDIINRSFRPQSDDGLEVSLHDGRRVQLSISALSHEPGQLIVLTDLTQTRQLQAKIAHMQRLSTLGNMMASLAHQLRTPLSSAMLYAQNLAAQNLPEQSRSQFQQKLCARLQDLENQINDLLLFARAGREPQVSAVSMQQLLNAVNATVETMLLQANVNLTVRLPDPDLAVLGNHSALAGAIGNLIQNALQHSKPGQAVAGGVIELSAELVAGQKVLITVEDHGPGVATHLQQRIFEPFFTTRSQGTGLGLAVVQAVVNSHSGDVVCQTGRDGGARFAIYLPLFSAEAEQNHAQSQGDNCVETNRQRRYQTNGQSDGQSDTQTDAYANSAIGKGNVDMNIMTIGGDIGHNAGHP
jgi:two-component system sensor histidine kinase FlrB